MPRTVLLLMGALSMLLSACAIREALTPVATIVPTIAPVILPPPPEQVVGGACIPAERNLEFYLQTATTNATLFEEQFRFASTQPAGERAILLVTLAAIRDESFRTATPECGMFAQSVMTAAMNRGVEVINASIIDPGYDLSAAADAVLAMFEQVHAAQDALLAQLDAQLSSP